MYAHQVRAVVQRFDNHIACHVHFIGVITRAALQRVDACSTNQRVIAVQSQDSVIARQPIDGVGVGGAGDLVRAGSWRISEKFTQRFGTVGELELLGITCGYRLPVSRKNNFCGGGYGDHVSAAGAGQHDRVGPRPATDGVVALPAVQSVVASAARQCVGNRVAVDDVGVTGTCSVLDHRAVGDA